MRKLYVGNISYSVTEDEIKALFSEKGQVESVKIITDQQTGQSKGFGFVEMSTDEEADECVKSLNGHDLGGRPLKVDKANPPKNRDRGGGGRGGFGGGRGGRGGFGGGRGGRY